MNKSIMKSLSVMLAAVLIITALSCAAPPPPNQVKTMAAQSVKRVVPVQRGELVVSVSVDGNLNMPQAFDLHFGAPGDVKEVLVKEGDRVKAGAILARLDDTLQRLDVKSSNNSVQMVLSNLYETVPRLPLFPTTFYDVNSTVTPGSTTTVTGWHDNFPTTGTHNWVYGTYTVTIPSQTIYTNIEKPRFDFKWDDINKAWYRDPNASDSLPYGAPDYYANPTAISALLWAVDSVSAAHWFTFADNLTTAASELYVASADLEATAMILEDAITNPDSGLGNMAPLVPTDASEVFAFDLAAGSPPQIILIVELRKAIKAVRQSQADIEMLRNLLQQGRRDEAATLFEPTVAGMSAAITMVYNNIRSIEKRSDTDVYGKEITVKLYNAAEQRLNSALRGVETGGLQSAGLYDNLRIARHYMELANGIVGSNDYVLQHGLSLKAENQYKVDLEAKLIDLDNKKEDFLKTVIMAPVDGVIVSVATKIGDVLSQEDYASKGTIQLVDTSQIKFQGLVDEIDILKIKTGQRASVSLDAVPEKVFPGSVSFISPFGTADTSGVVKFNVTVLLDPTDVDLKGGLTASADIGISKTENALMVPLAAVTTDKEGSSVNVETDNATGKAEKRAVQLGNQNQQMVQILEGLKEGEKVVVEIKATDISVRTTPGPPPGAGGGGPPR